MRLEELAWEEAVGALAASVRRLFPAVSEQQARELARLVLRDLAGRGISMARRWASDSVSQGD